MAILKENFFHKSAAIEEKIANFLSTFFGKKYFQNHNIGPSSPHLQLRVYITRKCNYLLLLFYYYLLLLLVSVIIYYLYCPVGEYESEVNFKSIGMRERIRQESM
jgi:hypothetical protein